MKNLHYAGLIVVMLGIAAFSPGCVARSHVASDPEGATIYLNDIPQGDTPLHLAVPDIIGLGSVYIIKAEKEGYKTQIKTFVEQGIQGPPEVIPPTMNFVLIKKEGKPLAQETRNVGLFVKSDIDKLPGALSKTRGNAYAVVIGVEQYRQKLPGADFAIQDAKLVAEYLTNALGYREENVIILTSDRAAKSDFEKYFEKWLPNNVEPGSTVFVYYSGHGAPNPRTGDAYLVPYDGDPAFIDETGYSLKRMYAALGRLPAKEIIVALDSCFSGAGGRSVIAKGSRPLVMNMQKTAVPKNMIVLSASAGDQTSSTYDEKGHGLFTYFLLKGIKNEDVVRQDGSLDVSTLFDYIKPQVSSVARKKYNNEQTPQLIEPKK